MTWNNVPAADTTPLVSLGAVSVNTWYEVDISSLITNDEIYSLRRSSTLYEWRDYSSKEGAKSPELQVVIFPKRLSRQESDI